MVDPSITCLAEPHSLNFFQPDAGDLINLLSALANIAMG